MEEIYIDIYRDSCDSITTIQGNNTNKLYKIIITENKKRIDLTNKSVKMAYINSQQIGDIIEGLEITNAVEGEITLPITNVLTKQDGIYGCQLAIYNSNGFLEHTGAFSLIVKENLFNKVSSGLLKTTTYQKLTSILEHSEEMAKNLADAKEVNGTLKDNISTGKVLNTSLSSNITTGNNINGSLVANALTAGEKNTELNKSLEETKKYIDGLDGSQNIPQIRLDVTELQNGLKNNQALEYEGSNLTCENTYDGRTESMTIEGMTLINVSNMNFKDKNEFTTLDGNFYNLTNGYISFDSTQVTTGYSNAFSKSFPLVKPNTIYTLCIDILENTLNMDYQLTSTYGTDTVFLESYTIPIGTTGSMKRKLTSRAGVENAIIGIRSYANLGTKGNLKFRYYILEGDYTNKPIPPYFEGIKSVSEEEGNKVSILSCGKNLFDKNKPKHSISTNTNEEILSNGIRVYNTVSGDWLRVFKYIKVKPNTDYFCDFIPSKTDGAYVSIRQMDLFNLKNLMSNPGTFNSGNNTELLIAFYCTTTSSLVNSVTYTDISVVEGTVKKEYTPYLGEKKEILLNEPLRGFPNGAKDIIEQRDDGVYLIKKYNAKLYEGKNAEGWIKYSSGGTGTTDYITFATNIDAISTWSTGAGLICNNFANKTGASSVWQDVAEGIVTDGSQKLIICIAKSKLTTQDGEGFKKWLQANPTTVYYELVTPVETKLLDISDLDLETYNTVTNIMSNNSIPATLKFKIASNLGSLIQNNAKSINDLYKLIDEIVMPGLQKTMAASLLNNIK